MTYMYLFFKGLLIVFIFAKFRAETLERILSTFVKVNRLPFISEIFSVGPKLIESKISSRLD